jgi:hypothetical protein
LGAQREDDHLGNFLIVNDQNRSSLRHCAPPSSLQKIEQSLFQIGRSGWKIAIAAIARAIAN